MPSMEEMLIEYEQQMWSAFAQGDAQTFRTLVSPEACMICGGFRETGEEYAQIVSQIRLDGFELSDFAVKCIQPGVVLLNYVASVSCPDPDLAGRFRVSSLWVERDGTWTLIFNQDSPLPR